MSTIERMLKTLRPHRLWLIMTAFLSLLGTALNIAFAGITKTMTDSAISKDIDILFKYIPIFIVLFIVDILASITKTYTSGRYAEYSLYDIRQKTAEHIIKLPVSYIDNHKSGDLVSRLVSDITIIQDFLQNTLSNILYLPILFVAALISLLIINWKLALFSITLIPLFMFVAMKISRPVEKLTKEQQEEVSKVNSIAQDSLSGLTVIKSFNLEGIMKERFGESVDSSVSKGLKVSKVNSILAPFGFLMQMIPFILTFAYGGYLVIIKEMTFGSLLAFINLMNYVANPINQFPRLLSSYRGAMGASSRIFEIWDASLERKDGEGFDIDKEENAVSFKNVCFSYNGETQNIFEGLTFDIKKGERIAIVGQSGAGKSTLLKLITEFYEANSGDISIFGHNIKSWRLKDLRNLISQVTQDTYLFPESINQNISYGREGVSFDDVVEAAKAADIHDVIMDFKDGYETLAGERGAKLSGGQKQRISIARALLKDSPLLLLDEATSALDVEAERDVQNALDELMYGRTTIVIAHRLSTIKNADRIIVIDDGKVVDSGSHEELFKKDGLYKELYTKQFAVEEA